MIFLIVPAAIFFLDFFVKRYIEKNKVPGEAEEKLGGKVVITRVSNYGAAGGRLQKHPGVVRFMNGLALLGMAVLYIRLLMEQGRTGLKLGCGFILGGGASNLYDRMFKGSVTDYVQFRVPVKRISKLIFNISDFFIILGCIFNVILSLIKE